MPPQHKGGGILLYATVRQRKIYVKRPETVIQNGVNVDDLILEMDDEWAAMDTIVAVFTLKYMDDGEKEIAKEMFHTFGKPLRVPWECLTHTGRLFVSCTGYKNAEKVMTTMYPESFWNVVQSGPVTGDTPLEPTPTLYEQIMAAYSKANDAAENAENVAEQLLEDKENGLFNGDDYILTEADKHEIAELAADLVDVPGGSPVEPDVEVIMDVLLALGLAPVILDGDGSVLTEKDGTLLLI